MTGPLSSPESSSRFQGSTLSVAVGVDTLPASLTADRERRCYWLPAIGNRQTYTVMGL